MSRHQNQTGRTNATTFNYFSLYDKETCAFIIVAFACLQIICQMIYKKIWIFTGHAMPYRFRICDDNEK